MCSNKTAKLLITNRKKNYLEDFFNSTNQNILASPLKKCWKKKKSQTPVGFLLWVITITKDYVLVNGKSRLGNTSTAKSIMHFTTLYFT